MIKRRRDVGECFRFLLRLGGWQEFLVGLSWILGENAPFGWVRIKILPAGWTHEEAGWEESARAGLINNEEGLS